MQNNVNSTTSEKSSSKSGSTGSNGKWSAKAADVSATADYVSDQARKIYDQAGATVREYPVYATLGGFFLGVLIGSALFRSTSEA